MFIRYNEEAYKKAMDDYQQQIQILKDRFGEDSTEYFYNLDLLKKEAYKTIHRASLEGISKFQIVFSVIISPIGMALLIESVLQYYYKILSI